MVITVGIPSHCFLIHWGKDRICESSHLDWSSNCKQLTERNEWLKLQPVSSCTTQIYLKTKSAKVLPPVYFECIEQKLWAAWFPKKVYTLCFLLRIESSGVEFCYTLNGCTLFYTESGACVVGTLKLIWSMNVMITNLRNDFK